jgi:hypothetical protein
LSLLGPNSPSRALGTCLLRIRDYTQLDTSHSVGLLWTFDRLIAETFFWEHTTLKRHRHLWPGGIRTRNPGMRAVENLVLKPRSQWDRQLVDWHVKISRNLAPYFGVNKWTLRRKRYWTWREYVTEIWNVQSEQSNFNGRPDILPDSSYVEAQDVRIKAYTLRNNTFNY